MIHSSRENHQLRLLLEFLTSNGGKRHNKPWQLTSILIFIDVLQEAMHIPVVPFYFAAADDSDFCLVVHGSYFADEILQLSFALRNFIRCHQIAR